MAHGVASTPEVRLPVVPEHECAVSALPEDDRPVNGSAHMESKRSPFFRVQRRQATDRDVSALSAHGGKGNVSTAACTPKPSIPDCITANRELVLTKSQLLSNRRHLEAPVVKLVEAAVKPFVGDAEFELVAKAIAEMMVHVDEAETAESLVDLLARRLPVLERIAAHWQNMGKVCLHLPSLSRETPTDCRYSVPLAGCFSNTNGISRLHCDCCSVVVFACPSCHSSPPCHLLVFSPQNRVFEFPVHPGHESIAL